MMEHPLSPYRTFLPATLVLFLAGWGGLALLFFFSLPTVWPRWLFFVLWDLALTGTALPVVWFLNLRFPGNTPANDAVIIRQAIWVGIYGATLAWLQLGHASSLSLTIVLAIGLAVIELLIRMREQSRWQPPVEDKEVTASDPEPETDERSV